MQTMEHKMKTTLLLSTLAASLIVAATPLFAQSTASGPPYPYPQGYQQFGASGSTRSGFGSSDYGYEGPASASHREAAQNRASPRREKIR
jgi:hypothetical protein